MDNIYHFFTDGQTVMLSHVAGVKLNRAIPLLGSFPSVEVVLIDGTHVSVSVATIEDAQELARSVSASLQRRLHYLQNKQEALASTREETK